MAARFLIHDRDTTFSAAFDNVFTSQKVTIIRTPAQAPNANACAERWIRSVREECLDKIVILGEAHLRRVLRAYVTYNNTARPHQGSAQRCPIPLECAARDGPSERRDILGGDTIMSGALRSSPMLWMAFPHLVRCLRCPIS